ncbi:MULTISPECIES: RraA family protein [Rhodomicrobium]|uniref:RraA family protein n=1 Tax=Rhodomicrobium TaxID=1068 RepID=UPI000B4B0436|nr:MULTISPECIES: RraA family protein [Rhodomicrobium]
MTNLAEILDVVRGRLYVAVLSDVLDELGYRGQALPSRIRPLDDTLVLAGHARTGLYRDVYHIAPGENPYALEIALIDSLKAGEVAVLGCGNTGRIAPWGELLSTAARARGAGGCLTDGLVRDTRAIRAMGFPVFHGGIGPLDSKGRGVVAAIDVPIECAGVPVESGDLVVGDADGIVIVPRAIQEEVIARALAKVEGENATRAALERGDSLADVFERFGVL